MYRSNYSEHDFYVALMVHLVLSGGYGGSSGGSSKRRQRKWYSLRSYRFLQLPPMRARLFVCGSPDVSFSVRGGGVQKPFFLACARVLGPTGHASQFPVPTELAALFLVRLERFSDVGALCDIHVRSSIYGAS